MFSHRTKTPLTILFCLFALTIFVRSGSLFGQTPAPMSLPNARTQTIEELLPLYLIEKNGNLVPAVNWTPGELDELLSRSKDQTRGNSSPDYVCERLTLSGKQIGEKAELDVQMDFSVQRKNIVQIPLKFNGAILSEPPKLDSHLLLIKKEGTAGYELYIINPDNAPRSENVDNPGGPTNSSDSNASQATETPTGPPSQSTSDATENESQQDNQAEKADSEPENSPGTSSDKSSDKNADKSSDKQESVNPPQESEKPSTTDNEPNSTHSAPAQPLPLGAASALVQRDSADSQSGRPAPNQYPDGSNPVIRVSVRLKVLAPITRKQSVHSLRMQLPNALYSHISLETPFESIESKASAGVVLQPNESLPNGFSRLSAYSLGSEFELSWQLQDGLRSETGILESYSEITAQIRAREVFFTSRVNLQFASRSPETFRMYLPASTELLPSAKEQYTIKPIQDPEPDKNPDPRRRQCVEIALTNRYENSADLEFQARMSLDSELGTDWFDLMGFEIRQSARHWGYISIHVQQEGTSNERQILWNPGRNVRRVDELPPSFTNPSPIAFVFDDQPSVLSARFVSSKIRINVQPHYIAGVNADEVRLEANWNYNIRGGQVSWLNVGLGDWVLDGVLQDNTVTEDFQDESGRVSIRLNQPTTGNIQIKLLLHRDLARTQKDLSLSLPRPSEDVSREELTISPGRLDVVCESNVKLTPLVDASRNIVRQLYVPTNRQFSKSADVLCYRLDSPDAVFAASRTVHRQEIYCSAINEIRLQEPVSEVTQYFNYQALYEPMSQVVLEGPESLAEMTNLSVSLDGQKLPVRTTIITDEETKAPGAIASSNGSFSERGKTRIVAVLDRARIGSFCVQLNYQIKTELPKDDKSTAFSTPLAQSMDPARSANSAGTDNSAKLSNDSTIATDSPLQMRTVLVLYRRWELQSANLPWTVSGNSLWQLPSEINQEMQRIKSLSEFPSDGAAAGMTKPTTTGAGTITGNSGDYANEDQISPKLPTGGTSSSAGNMNPRAITPSTFANANVEKAGNGSGTDRNGQPAGLESGSSGSLPAIDPDVPVRPALFQEYSVLDLHAPIWNSDLGQLTFQIRRRQGMPGDTLIVERSWIQTWLTMQRRQDIAVFLFSTDQKEISIGLPVQMDPASLEILLDGQPVSRYSLDPGLQVKLSIPESRNEHVLEMSYYFSHFEMPFGTETCQLPYIKESEWTRWMYWSVGMPRNIHLLIPPQQLNPEYSWQRQGPFFRRNSVYSQQELENWSGGVHLPPPPQGVNLYLFSGFGKITQVEFTLLNRTTLVLFASLLVLAPGLLVLHFRRVRRPWLMVLTVIVLLGGAFWEPELALVLTQGASLGVMLLALSYLLRKRPRSAINENQGSTVSQPQKANSDTETT